MKSKILAICLSALTVGFASAQPNTAAIYTTADNSQLRLTQGGKLSFTDSRQPLETEPFILVDPHAAFQTIIGIGGALTDASAETFARIPKSQQEELLRAYYDPQNGIGYTLARTNIQSCDFSSATYSYIKDNDTALASFSVAHDEQYRIPLIKRAIAAAGGHLRLFVSPWSPPGWMKDNNDVLHGGHLRQQEYGHSWASFYVKFIETYEAQGIPIWGLSVQNEPMAKQKWESCIYTAEEERDFIKNYLGPVLQSSGLGDKKL
ncbi:MAG TPA: glycosyl hydrolase, partial [Puia sp.]